MSPMEPRESTEIACLHHGCLADDYERALEMWRTIAARTARIIEAQTFDVKALGKRRREVLERTVARLREAALGDPEVVYAGVRYPRDELRLLREAQDGE